MQQMKSRSRGTVQTLATAGVFLTLIVLALLAAGCGNTQSWDEWQQQWQQPQAQWQPPQWQPWNPWASSDQPRSVATPTPLTEIQDVPEFNQQVHQARGPVLVDFYKESCPTCVLQDAVLKELNGEYGSRVRFVRFKVREATMISSTPEFMDEHRLFWVPTTVLYVDGREQQRWTLNHAAWEFRPALTAAAAGNALPAGTAAAKATAAPDPNAECTGEGCPINRTPPRLTDRTPAPGATGSTPKNTGTRLVP